MPTPPDPLPFWRRWSLSSLLLASAILALAIIGLTSLFEPLRYVFFMAFMSCLLAIVLNFPISLMARSINRGLATVIVLFACLAVFAAVIKVSAPAVSAQTSQLAETAPEVLDRLEDFVNSVTRRAELDGISDSEDLKDSLSDRLRQEGGRIAEQALPVAFGTLTAISSAVIVFALAFFIAYSPASYARGILRMTPPHLEAAVREYLERVTETLKYWVGGTVAAMAFIGTASAIGLGLIGLDSWLVLAILHFFGEFIPYVGPITAAIPAIAIGFADSTRTGLYVIVFYIFLQQAESFLVQPLIMKRAVELSPAVLIAWQVLMAGAFGFIGVLVATPLLAVIKTTVDFWYVERTLGKK